MKIQYLGTAAFEGLPAFFCECDVCKRSIELGGKNLRTRSQALIDDKILIDFPADTFAHFLKYKVPLSKIKTCLITHSHSDHLYPYDIAAKRRGYSVVENREPICFYSDKSAYDKIDFIIDYQEMQEDDIQNNLVKVNVPFEAEGYKITPLRANHSLESTPLIFLIEKDGKSILYGNDSGEFPEETWECLKNSNVKIDLVSFDCTMAWSDNDWYGHLSMARCIKERQKMIDMGIVHKDTVYALNHFSHNGADVVYDDMVKTAGAEGFVVTYDGLVVEV